MDRSWDLSRLLPDSVLNPRVSDEELQRTLEKLRRELPVPVFWLLGKAQSGKTSLIRALTGSTHAEIGNGFRPCTRTAHMYSFPNDDQPFVKFLDTRGLGEVDYDPALDMGHLEAQAHLLVVVMKAMDHAQEVVLGPLRRIRDAHPGWPVIVLQTALHEGYPPGTTAHLLPYPYGTFPFPAEVPTDVARSLSAQRNLFSQSNVRFVPVDLTLPEDGFQPENYGLDAFWSAVEDLLPVGFVEMLRATRDARKSLRDVYFQKSHPHIVSHAVAAGLAAGIPVPLVDVPLVIAVQAKMFHALASIYGQKLTAARVAEVAGAIGLSHVARLAVREMLKLIPGVGSVVTGVYAAAVTYALGRTLCVYFSHALEGDLPSQDALKRLFEEEYQGGRRWLARYLGGLARGGKSVEHSS